MTTAVPPVSLQQPRDEPARYPGWWLLAATVVFVALSLWGAISSEGFLEADGCTHYMYARFAVERPYLLLDVWGRPPVTALHALPAYFFGRIGVRVTSLVIALLCAAAVYHVAKVQQYRLPTAAVIFLFAQPLFYLHSFAELTELPFALLVILAFWAYIERRWFVTAVLISLTPVARPEGFGFVLLTAFAMLCHRRAYYIPLLAAPLMLWSLLGWIHARPLGDNGLEVNIRWWQWLINHWPYEQESNYGRGSLWHYAKNLPSIVGPLLVPAVLVGAAWCFRFGKLFGTGHRQRCDFVIAALPFGILLTHSAFWYFGQFSGGELRYHLVVGPFWALVAARGFEVIAGILRLRRPLLVAAIVAIVPLGANKLYGVLPIHLSPDEQIARRITEHYKASPELQRKYPRITTPVFIVYYFLDIPSTDPERAGVWRRDAIEHPEPGQFLIYESVLANYNSDKRMLVPLELIEQSGWVLEGEYARHIQHGKEVVWRVYLSPKTAQGEATVKP